VRNGPGTHEERGQVIKSKYQSHKVQRNQGPNALKFKDSLKPQLLKKSALVILTGLEFGI